MECVMFVSWLLAAIAKKVMDRRMTLRLREFDDRMLSDIGISRGQIPHVVRDGLSR
jgi:uncharacterized protein YjiS (DUF1127 family)